MLTQDEIDLVRSSFAHLAERADTGFDVFMSKLLETNPNARYLFSEDLAKHRRRFMHHLRFVVSRLDRWNQLEPYLSNLGVRHRVYGVRDSDYEGFISAFADSMMEVLDDAARPEVIASWVALIRLMSRAMCDASG